MKTRLTALLLCMLLLCLPFARAEEEPEFPEGWELADLSEVIHPELTEIEWDTDRAEKAPAQVPASIPETQDRVTIREDGSFEILCGDLRISSPQPFGWLYYTQSYEAQKDLYDAGPENLRLLVETDCHVLFSNTADNVLGALFVQDQLGGAMLIGAGFPLERTLQALSNKYKSTGQYDVRVAEFGERLYLVVTDLRKNFSVYQTYVDEIPVAVQMIYSSGFSDVFERFAEETVLAELSLAPAGT